MRRKQITAILMSAIMTVSTCVSAGGISALAAETADTGATQAAAVEEAAEEIAEEPEQQKKCRKRWMRRWKLLKKLQWTKSLRTKP